MASINVTSSEFEGLITKGGIVFVDFWAEWCGPCKMFGPIYEKVSEQYPDITFAKVDTEAEREIAAAAGITSIPTLMAFRDGILLYREAGALPEQSLQKLVAQVTSLDMDEVRAEIAKEATQVSN
ncbi:TrxA Thiol-disulfide isomerase and thioredoxins [Candidatus Nanopelagicaceae bacterium]